MSSMVTDVVEDCQAKTGQRSEGLIITADTLPQKLLASFSVVVPGLLLSAIGFPTGAQPGQVAMAIVDKMVWYYMLISCGLALASCATWSFFRIDELRHNHNLAKLSGS